MSSSSSTTHVVVELLAVSDDGILVISEDKLDSAQDGSRDFVL